MDAHPFAERDPGPSPTSGLKRKALPFRPTRTKKVRGNSIQNESAGDNFAPSDYEDSDSTASVDESAFTPLTPISVTSPHRHPSDVNKIHSCTFDGCTKSFNRPAKLEQHVRSHTNTRPFVCPEASCNKDFLRDSHLKHHVKSAHTNIRDYVCEWEGCEKRFLTATRLKRHEAAHEGREKYRCTMLSCGQTFRKHSTLQAHVLKIHEGKKPFVCSFLQDGKRCGAGFDIAAKLQSHQGRIHELKRYSCKICFPDQETTDNDRSEEGVAFSTYSELLSHIKAEHPPTCKVCGLKCSSQKTLKTHVEVQHGTVGVDERRTHICPEPNCGAGFTRKSNLYVHTRTVHGDTRFVCGEIDPTTLRNVGDWDGSGACGIATTTKANLEYHIRTAHLGVSPASNHGPQRNQKRVRKAPVTAMTRLTGFGYEESGRHIPCVVPDCQYRFLRDYDRKVHLRSHHALADLEIEALYKENGDGNTRLRLQGSTIYSPVEDLDADEVFDMQSGGGDAEMQDLEKRLEAAAFEGGDFWLGGQPDDLTKGGDDEWLGDEMQMKHLINDDYELKDFDEGSERPDTDVLDPVFASR